MDFRVFFFYFIEQPVPDVIKGAKIGKYETGLSCIIDLFY